MDLITLKQATRITSLSYTYLYENCKKLGFFQPLEKGKWLADKKMLEEKLKGVNNSDRLTSKEVIKCQSKNAVKRGILTSSRQMDRELGDLLVRQTKEKPKSTMTN